MYNYNDNKPSTKSEGFYSSNAWTGSNSDSNDYADHSRPLSITVIAWLCVISLGYNTFQLLGILREVTTVPAWIWLLLLVTYGLSIASIVGLFSMKKYVAWTYALQAAIGIVFGFITGAVGQALLTLVVSLIIMYFIFDHYERME